MATVDLSLYPVIALTHHQWTLISVKFCITDSCTKKAILATRVVTETAVDSMAFADFYAQYLLNLQYFVLQSFYRASSPEFKFLIARQLPR